MELLNINLAANETKDFQKAGSYMEVIDSTYPVDVHFYGDGGGANNGNMLGALSGLYMQRKYSAFQLTNGATAQTVKLLVADAGEIGGSRRQPGVVQVVDTNKSLTIAGEEFVMSGSSTPVAAQYGRVGIWNPANSTKRAIVTRVEFSSAAAADCYLAWGNVVPGSIDALIRNKLVGASAPQFVERAYDSVAALFSGTVTMYQWLATTGKLLELSTPIVVPPGYSLLVLTATANQAINASFDFLEEDNL